MRVDSSLEKLEEELIKKSKELQVYKYAAAGLATGVVILGILLAIK